MPWPKVKGKPRSRNADGRIRKKRSDTGKRRGKRDDDEISLEEALSYWKKC